GIVTAFVQAQAKVITGVTRWVASVVRGFTNLRSNVVNYVKALWTSAGNLFTSGANRLGTIAGRGVTRVVSFFRELPRRIKNAVGSLGSLLLQAGKNVVQGLIDGITSQISRLAGAASRLAGTIRSYLPFSPAKVGPLSGSGSPDISGATIAQMVADGIQTNVNLPARAMQNALAPLAPDGAVTQSVGQGAARRTAPVASPANDGVSITQIFNGPTTSGGRLQEINWNVRYATQA